MLMTVIRKDAEAELSPSSQEVIKAGSLSALLYADDTLIMGSSSERLQEFLDSVSKAGGRYGLSLHWSKFQLLQVGGECRLCSPDGNQIEAKEVMSYLGVSIYDDGGVKTELNRKLGAAWGNFCNLDRVWKHTSLSTARKVAVYNAIVVSRLLYGLSSAWLNAAEIRRLNGFHCRCLRKITRIRPSFVSRVSNAAVLMRAHEHPLSSYLRYQQLLLFGRVARAPARDALRRATFHHGLEPATNRYVRRIRRPRNEWARMLREEACKMSPQSESLIRDVAAWQRAVRKLFFCV